jgi:hypothetical protein
MPYRFTTSELIEESKRCRLISVKPVFIIRRWNGITDYMCPVDYIVLFSVKRNRTEINFTANEDDWYFRDTCCIGCNHFRWYVYTTEELQKYLNKFSRHAVAVLSSDKVAFVLDKRREGYPGLYTKG